jgi:hypothetical protein
MCEHLVGIKDPSTVKDEVAKGNWVRVLTLILVCLPAC